jgi:sulfur-oxidizing protein SoxY
MNRRKFLTLSVATAITLPMMAMATDYRTEKPAAWTAHTVDNAVKALYGDVKLIQSGDLILKMPKVTSNGGAVPVGIKSTIKAKSVSLFQNSNPESAVAVWTVPENGIVDYGLKLKIKTLEDGSPSVVTIILEGLDGKYYTTSGSVKVAGGCEG